MSDFLSSTFFFISTYFLFYRHAKNYVEEHSGDLNKLQHFTESRIRVRKMQYASY